MIKIKRESILAFAIFLPYIERGFIDNILSYKTDDAYFRSMLLFLICGTFMLLFYTNVRKKKGVKKLKVLKWHNWLFWYLLVIALLHLNFGTKNISVMLWFFLPMIFGYSFVYMCRKVQVNIPLLMTTMIKYFAVYVVISLVYNFLFYGLFRRANVRMTTPGGGSVIFAYTTAFVFALTLAYKDYFKNKDYLIVMALFTVGAIACGSRGGMWPILGMWFYYYAFSEITLKRIVITFAGILGVIILNPIKMMQVYFPHLFLKTNHARGMSSSNLLTLFWDSPMIEKLFGHGPGEFFPYQEWIMDVSYGRKYSWDNYVLVDGLQVLVQPHNSYIYMLYEYGVVAVFMLALFLIVNIFVSWKSEKQRNKFFMILPVPVFAFVNCFDSILFVQPGAAAIMWMLLLVYLSDVNERVNIRFRLKKQKKE